MSGFTVHLRGGPFPGSRWLHTDRQHPPRQIPVISDPSRHLEHPSGDVGRRVAIYRLCPSEIDGDHRYDFIREIPLGARARPRTAPPPGRDDRAAATDTDTA